MVDFISFNKVELEMRERMMIVKPDFIMGRLFCFDLLQCYHVVFEIKRGLVEVYFVL